MRQMEEGVLSGALLELVRDAGLRRLNRPPKGEWSQDFTLVDRRLPSPTFRRREAGLSSKLEAPSDLRLDPGPAAEPSGKMLDSQQPFEYGGSRRSDAHPEIVVERH